jgi:hypothetical protein
MGKQVYIYEEDLPLLQDAIYARIKQLKANAERTKVGYGSCRSDAKRAQYLERADDLEVLITRIAYEFI